HRHFILSTPKILRRYFLYDRRLLSELSRCAWDSLKVFFQTIVPEEDAVPGAVIAIQTFGDFLGFNSHCHVLCTDGGFYGKGMFRVSPWFIPKDLEKLFRYKVFKMLLSRKKISEDLIDMMMGWWHSGFNVYCGPRIQPGEEEAIENLARYIIRASFSQERMTYIPEESKVLYRSKDGKKENIFDALEWLAAMCSHVPNKGEQMVRYYGYYSNVSRGKRKKQNQDVLIPCILEPDESSRESRKNWARLIQKIYEVDLLTCPKCSGAMKVISVIEDEGVIKKILKHLGLWEVKPRPPPKATCLRADTHRQAGPQKTPEYRIDYSVSQLPTSDKWLYVDPEYPEVYPPLEGHPV
ncbi:MAG: transposase, partial [Pseudomonadota bacterium]